MASIEQRGSSWRVIWRHNGAKCYTSWPAEQYAIEAKTIVEAHRGKIAADRVYADMGVPTGESESPEENIGPTVREWCEEWLPSKTRITPGVRERYAQQLRDRIYPEFGDVPLALLTPVMVGTWLNSLRTSGLSPKTATRYYAVLHGALRAAVRQGVIPVNPCHGTDFVRDQRADDDTGEHRAVYLTPKEFELLRAQFAEQWWPLLDCLIETGARWSEATALAAQHLVPATATEPPKLKVWRAWKRAQGRRYLGTTKGRAKRTLPISVELYATLAKLVAGQPPDTLMFRDGQGTALEYDFMYHQVWKPALLRARRCPEHPPVGEGREVPGATGRCRDHGGTTWDGQPCGALVAKGKTRCSRHYGPAPDAVSTCDCPGVLRVAPSWHDLRHSCAGWLFSDPSVTPLTISRRLGHAQLATTSEIYGDLMPTAEVAAVAAISAARRSGQEGN